jgi:hypothetical protein
MLLQQQLRRDSSIEGTLKRVSHNYCSRRKVQSGREGNRKCFQPQFIRLLWYCAQVAKTMSLIISARSSLLYTNELLPTLFAVAQNLQNIIQDQIQSLSSGTSVLPSVIGTSNSQELSSAMSRPPPPPPQQQQQQHHHHHQHQHPPPPPATMIYGMPQVSSLVSTAPPVSTMTTSTSSASSASTLNSNAQAALMILLTAQMQSQTGEPSLLQNPQVVGILQNLVTNSGDKTSVDVNELLKDPSLSSVLRGGGLPTSTDSGSTGPRPALLDTPKTRPILLTNPPPPVTSTYTPTSEVSTAASPTMVANNLNNMLNAQNLNQLLGSLSSSEASGQPQQPPAPQPPVPQQIPSQQQQPQQQQALLAPQTSLANGLYQRPVLFDGSQSLMGFPTGYPTTASNALYFQQQQQQQLYAAHQQQQQQQQSFMSFQGYPMAVQPGFMYGQNPMGMTLMAAPQVSLASNGLPAHMVAYAPQNSQLGGSSYSNVQTAASTTYNTPIQPPNQGLKRRLAIPPSPEQSPEGPYIGQHSQGIGGHYASSYLNKRAKY